MPGITPALDFLACPASDVPPVCVVFGDEAFLKRESLDHLRQAVLGDEDGAFSLDTFDGDEATPQAVFDGLSTLAMFGAGRRLVVVRDADDFVTAHRGALEAYVARPKPSGVLVVEVRNWPANTKLAKAVAASGLTVECRTPAPAALVKWLVGRAKTKYRAKLARDAAELLTETIEPELGLLDQELAELALAAGIDGTIEAPLVRELVGGWRTRTTWDMLDMALAGDAAHALVELDRLLAAGESPIAILAQIGSSLRRFAATARLVERALREGRRLPLRQALEAAGFKGWVVNKAEPQIRQLGSARCARLYRWLLDADLAAKGTASAPVRARIVLEQLISRLSKAAAIA